MQLYEAELEKPTTLSQDSEIRIKAFDSICLPFDNDGKFTYLESKIILDKIYKRSSSN